MSGTRLPSWIRVRTTCSPRAAEVQDRLTREGLNTVCQSAQCPNRGECYARGTATFMVLGAVCTRACAFCAVGSGTPAPIDPDEPGRVAKAARAMCLRHVVVTSVTRDDLPDGGAGHFAAVIAALRRAMPAATIEVLTPDFGGKAALVRRVLTASPDVFNHNLETVRRLQSLIRPAADYARSLAVLRIAAQRRPILVVKSGLMVGLGETDAELYEAIADLREVGCCSLTIGQYLAPTRRHLPVARYVSPMEFEGYRRRALAMGFTAVASAPLVRSSYHAEAMLESFEG